ncbi:hypothetical protein [Nostoc punctiforme]|uniref:hypothetical protein n=1 Tax=Nostoc punctiforme TaxID=272131 RepID=UPI001427C59F|nr:hypothetical protein [Nostoc punctiforme]
MFDYFCYRTNRSAIGLFYNWIASYPIKSSLPSKAIAPLAKEFFNHCALLHLTKSIPFSLDT